MIQTQTRRFSSFLKTALALSAALPLALSGCVVFKNQPKSGDSAFKQVLPARLPDFSDSQDRTGLIESAENSLSYLSQAKETLYTVGDVKVTPALLAASLKEFIKIAKEAKTQGEFAAGIAEKFDVYRSLGSDGNGKVVFTSYYEPVFKASKVKTSEYKYPLYRRPTDLVDVDLEDFNPEKYKGEQLSGKVEDSKLVPYFPRSKIDLEKLLEGKGLELAWLRDRFDVMDLHIEGSARLEFTDGTTMRASYAGTNSLQFRGPFTTLINSGVISKDEATTERIRKYVTDHPEIEDWVLSTNPRYTFFKLDRITDPRIGPIGTYGGPLVGGRSLAVDPKHVPLGAIAFVDVPLPRLDSAGKLLAIAGTGRFAICQDTGGAIKGPGRVDYYAGTGDHAGNFAGRVKNSGSLYLLLLKLPEY